MVPTLLDGWRGLSRRKDAADLAVETSKRFSLTELTSSATISSVVAATMAFSEAALRALAEATGTLVAVSAEIAPEAVSAVLDDEYPLAPLDGTPRIQGSVWKPRILWALEWARRHDPGPKSAADIAKILTDHGVAVPGTNTARAFRTEQDDPRATGLVEQTDGQCYTITEKGRYELFELLMVLAR